MPRRVPRTKPTTGSIGWRPPNSPAQRRPSAFAIWCSSRRSAGKAGHRPRKSCGRTIRRARPTPTGVPSSRPRLIYGTGARGNLARLIELARKPWPLPLGLCRNRRSLLARENLIGAIHFVLAQPLAKGETYIVADPAPLTLAEIVGAIRAG